MRTEIEEIWWEFGAKDDMEAISVSRGIVNDCAGPTGVDILIEYDWIDPVIEEIVGANLRYGDRQIVDLLMMS